MKTHTIVAMAAVGAAFFATNQAKAQDTVVVEDESVSVVQAPECKTRYYSDGGDNWFIQLGAGIQSPFVENYLTNGDPKHHITPVYNVGFGKWFSPYIGWRLSFNGGAIHYDDGVYTKAKIVNGSLDFMWDMCNSLGGVNSSRPVSVIPFIGVGANYLWDIRGNQGNIMADNGKIKHTQWSIPVSAGIQFRFRPSRYVDLFLEGRAQVMGDNFNNIAFGEPVDVNIMAIGGISINIGGADFKKYNPCDNLAYISSLNEQVNGLRAEVAATSAALAAAQAQLPCPPQTVVVNEEVTAVAPVYPTVRFTINSARISDEEMVNVYNMAQYMTENPEVSVVIKGYADEDTGTSAYNMQLSERRAQAVYNVLVNTYGISPDRLSTVAEGSSTQVYDTNNWNRIVIFAGK
ncbi:MAG: OmpA family protein [Muribaculaceae bacterium]|nr:OmpA family protein [Muribaculaceae bacterium]